MKTKIYISIFLVLVLTVIIWLRNMGNHVKDSYAAWNATKIVTAYIIKNKGTLPTKWSDFEGIDPNINSKAIAEIKNSVEIEFKHSSIRITTNSGKRPFYNSPNDEIEQVILESKMPKNKRSSNYWRFYTDFEDANN